MLINPQEFIVEIPDLHPATNEYVSFWREQKKRSVEGYWLGGYYMPPSLYFYVNLGTIQLNKGESNVKKFDRPWLRDLEWLVFRYYTACRGFSGFELDTEYSSHSILLDPLIDDETLVLSYPSTVKQDGTRKEYIAPMTNLEMQHPYHKGRALFYNQAKNGMLLGSRDTGKGLPLDTLIPTPSGFVEIKDLEVGSTVFGVDGKTTQVTGVFPQGRKKTYRLTLADGRNLVTDEDHLNLVYDGNKEKVLSSKEIAAQTWKHKHKKSGFSYRFSFPIIESVEYGNRDIKIPPYVLGVLLGDGDMKHPTPRLSTDDAEILEKVLALVPFLSAKKDTTNNNYSLSVRDRSKTYWGYDSKRANPLAREIRKLGLNVSCNDKFIPEDYLFNSTENRLELLRGLLDTDGSITKSGSIEFTNKSEKLSTQVLELCRSLGIRAQIGIEDRRGKIRKFDGKKDAIIDSIYYRVYVNTAKEVFSLSRKKNRLKKTEPKKISLVNIEELVEEQTVCISVDNDSKTYLATKDYIPTHNSYSVGVGMSLKEWLFDGATVYNEDSINHPAAVDITVGAEDSQKSGLMITKMRLALERLPGSKIINGRLYPSPLTKQYVGSWMVGKQITAEYQKKYPGGWKTVGSQSTLKHRSFKDNPFADQGARNLLIVLEEIGMFNGLKEVFYNTRDNLQDGDRKIGTLFMLGTGGDMEGGTLDAQEMFYNPEAFDIFYFNDVFENRGKIGLFIPATIAVNSFKDSQGFTDYEKAKNYWLKKREHARTSSKGSDVLNKLIQYRPLVPSEMFLSRHSTIFPSVELQKRLGEVRDHKIYDLLEKRVNLYFDPKSPYNGVNYDINNSLQPINEHPWKHDNAEGAVVLYELPHLVEERVPQGAYIIGCDAFKDNSDGGSSFAAIYVMKSNKYPSVVGYDEIVATYVGRPYMGMSEVCEILYKLSMFYGNATIYFENTAGNIKGYFEKIRRLDLLATQPTSVLSRKASHNASPGSNVVYGYPMSNDKIKWEALQYVRTWLLQERELVNNVPKRNLDLITDPYLLQQLISFNLDGNFDAVMGLVGCIIGQEELHAKSRSKEEIEQYTMLDKEFINVFVDNKHLFR